MTNWKQLTITELEKWLPVLIYFGVVHLPHISDYWSEVSRTPFMKQCSISRNRWLQIRSALHFSSIISTTGNSDLYKHCFKLHGNEDPFYKIRKLPEGFLQRSLSVMIPVCNICFGELAIMAKNKSFPRIICRKLSKHTSAGFQFWTICSSSGYPFDFEPSFMGHAGLTPHRSSLLLIQLWTVYDGAEDGQGREDLLLMVRGWMVGQL